MSEKNVMMVIKVGNVRNLVLTVDMIDIPSVGQLIDFEQLDGAPEDFQKLFDDMSKVKVKQVIHRPISHSNLSYGGSPGASAKVYVVASKILEASNSDIKSVCENIAARKDYLCEE